jgi:hypothetical protein
MKPKQPRGPPKDLANMRSLGVRGLAIKCLQPALCTQPPNPP